MWSSTFGPGPQCGSIHNMELILNLSTKQLESWSCLSISYTSSQIAIFTAGVHVHKKRMSSKHWFEIFFKPRHHLISRFLLPCFPLHLSATTPSHMEAECWQKVIFSPSMKHTCLHYNLHVCPMHLVRDT